MEGAGRGKTGRRLSAGLRMKPRVILVRESPEILTCSNCAGTLEGIEAYGSRRVPEYAATRAVMHRVGRLYAALRREFGDQVEIDVVDPRNGLYLIPALIRDYRRYRPPLRVFLKTLFFGIGPTTVIVNGAALLIGELPEPGSLMQSVRACLEDPDGAAREGRA